MTKKIFSVIGIVVASVLVFVGAVFGVMALMGKFKTPEVRPDRLTFVDNEQTIVYREQDSEKIYSFVLNGFSDNQEYEVNQKDCYIYFVDNIGADLITLCNEKGEPLQSQNNRYSIECNEYVYYTIKPVSESDFSQENYGRVILQARDARDQIQSDNNLTIWIDREISNVYLDYNNSNAYNGEQELTIGVDVSLDFVFDSNPLHSFDPISRESGKIVELYYYDPNESDYIPVNQDTYSSLPFINYDNDRQIYTFSSEIADSYEFRIAVFPTYQARIDYLNSESAQTDSYFERVSKMVNTTLILNVVNSEISNVGMNSTGVGLNLYSDNNYITLSGESGVQGANDNDLELYMIKDGQSTTIRFNEVDFGLNESKNWMQEDIVFTSDDGSRTIRFTQNTASITGFGDYDNTYNINFEIDNNRLNLTDRTTGAIVLRLDYNLGNIMADYNKSMIQSIACEIDDNTITFNCSTGAAFLIGSADEPYSIQAVRSGSYLEFYIYDTQSASYTKANDFDYSASTIGSGETKSWNIIAKNIPNLTDTQSLVLGILVVNNNGGAHFASTGVTVNPVELAFEFVDEDQTHNLKVEYERDENQVYQTIYETLDFSEIVNITNGSYNACVFVTPKVDIEEGGVYDIDVIDGMIFVDAIGNEYVLVGYMQGTQYVNKVRVRQGAKNSGTPIYMLQLRNQYDQTADEYIQSILENASNNIVLKYSIQMQDTEGVVNTKYVNVTMSNQELSAELVDGSAYISNVAVVNNELVVTISNEEYICSFESVSRDGGDVCLANRQIQSADEVADVVNSYITDTRRVTINVDYALITSEILFNYNPGSVDGVDNPEGDKFTNIEDGNVYVVENTTNHSLTISSNVPNMLKNIFNAGGFEIENVHIFMYNASNTLVSQNSNALEIQNLELLGDSLVLTYNSNSALSNRDSYLRVVLEYNGSQIITDSKIYIESTIATDIQFKYINNDNVVKTIALSQTPEEALSSSFYIEVEIAFNSTLNGGNGGYEYRYFIVDNSDPTIVTRKEISAIDLSNKLFNSSTSGEIDEGFQVLPAISSIEKNILYSSNSPSIVDFDAENNNLIINKIGKAVATVSSDDITRYFAISVVATQYNGESAFTLTDTSGLGESSTEELNVNLNDYITYTYNDSGTNIDLNTNSQFVSIENVKVVQFGGDSELEVVRDENTGYIYIIEADYRITGDGSIVEEYMVLRIESNDNSWVFTRVNYLYAGLIISFDINVKTNETISFELTFTSSIEINFNSEWENFYAGTTVLLYEEASDTATSTNPVFRIKNSTTEGATITCRVDINNSQSPINVENSEYTFSEVGTYKFSFLYDNSELASYTITVLPNVIAQIATSEFEGGETYNYSDFVTLKSFKTGTDVVYGSADVGVYPQTDDYLVDNSDYTNLGLTLQSGTIISLDENKFSIGWIENIGESLTENIRISYSYQVNNADRSIDLLETQVTLKNAYEISRETDGFPDYADQVYNIMSNINYNSFIEIKDNAQFKLTSLQANIEGVEFNTNENTFKLITNLDQIYDNVVLIFTFEDESGNRLIYSTALDTEFSVRFLPLVPDEIDRVAYSGLNSSNAFDLLNELYSVDDLLNDLDDKSIINSILVTGVSDNSIFADTAFLGSGYRNGKNDGAHAVISEINGNSFIVTITYQITYNDGAIYEFTRDLQIKNRQYLTITTPFNDESLTGTTTSFVFVGEDPAQDAENLLGTHQNGNIYQITIQKIGLIDYYFEPVNIGQTINFRFDEIQSVGRVSIFNSADNSVATDADFTIELVARQNNANTSNYYNNNQIVINNDDKSVIFNQHSSFGSNTYGYFIFKLTSNSGAVAYYFVYLYNQTNTAYNNVDYTNVYTMNSGENFDTNDENQFLNANTLLGVTIDQDFFNEHFDASINYSSVDFYLLDAEMLDGDYFGMVSVLSETADNETDKAKFGYGRYSKIDDKFIPAISNYTHLKIGMIFNSGTVKFYIGTIEAYVLPTYQEIINGDISKKIEGIETGEYTKTLTTDMSSFDIPFEGVQSRFNSTESIGGSWTAEIEAGEGKFGYESNSISLNGKTIVSIINNTTINLESYVNYEDLEFVVRYIFSYGENQFVLKVHYTYEQIGINTNPQTVTVGNFVSSGADGENSHFNNRLDLSTIVGNYKKKIIIAQDGTDKAEIDLSNTQPTTKDIITFTNGCHMRYVYENGNHYLEFDQTISDYVGQFEIIFNDVFDENNSRYSKTITANVLSGLYYSQPQSGSGYSEDNPQLSDLIVDNQYHSSIGSQITINSSKNDDTGVTRYYFGGLNIYTNVDSSLEITFSDNSYVTNLLDSGKLNIGTQGTIDFTHTAQDKILTLNINVLSGGDYYQRGGAPVTINYYVNVQRSYAGLVASYYTAGATHENVVSGYSISDIRTQLFDDISVTATDVVNTGDNIVNQKRIALIDLNGNHLLNYSEAAMGFTTQGNPNYITFTASEGASMPATGNSLNFSTVSTNTLSNLYLGNSAGVANVVYTYQIMSSTEYRDRLDYQLDTNGEVGTNEYVSLLIEDKAEGTPLVYGETTTDNGQTVMLGNHIATLSDGNNSVFYITYIDIMIDGRRVNYGIEKLDRVESSNYPDDIVYIISNINEINMTLTIRIGAGRQLYVGLQRNSGSLFNEMTVTLTLFGDSGNLITRYDGDGFTSKSLEIKFYNYSLESEYGTNYDSIFAGNYIDLSQKIAITSNAGNESISLSNATLVTGNSEGASSYMISGNRHYIQETNNNIFDYDESASSNLIMTKAVGVNINVNLIFNVAVGGYFIGYIQYNFTLRPNFEFRVNGSPISSGYDDFYTNYILTSGKLNSDAFPYTEDLSTFEGTNTTILYNAENYNTDLMLELYSADGSNRKITDTNNVSITESSSWGTGYFTIDGLDLKFQKDLSGLIILRLDINLRENGVYTIYWNINVLGFVTLQYRSATGENGILTHTSGEAFASGESVRIINTTSADGTGIIMSDTNGTLLETPSIVNDFTIGEIKVDYVVVPFTETIDADQLFNAGSAYIATLSYNNILSTNSASLTLPSVAQSSGPNYDYYNVIYRLSFNYLGQITNYYYVTYKVYNSASVNVNSDFTIVDVDDLSGNQLDLFYYTENYVSTSNEKDTITLYLNGSKNIVANAELSGSYSTYSGTYNRDPSSATDYKNASNTLRITSNNYVYTITILSGNSEISFTANRSTTTYNAEFDNVGSIINNSVFSSEYSNIDNFYTFINSVESVRLSDMTGFTGTYSEIYYQLISIGNGVFGIDLSDPKINSGLGSDYPNSKLFNNELIADLDVMASGNPIVHIEKYDENTNLGFKLTTTSAIVPKGQFRVRDIFLPTQCDSTSYLDYIVVGAGDPNPNWANNANSVTPGEIVGTIDVNGKKYNLQQLTFRGGSSDLLYNLTTDKYYAITGASSIVTVDYGTNIQSYFFQVNYTHNSDSVLDLKGKFATYQNVGGTFTKIPYTGSGSDVLDSIQEVEAEGKSYSDENSLAITVTKETLRTFKRDNPTKTALSINYAVEYKGVNLTFRVDFQLPEYPYVETTLTADGEISVNILGEYLKVYNSDGELVELTDANKEIISSIVENNTNYISEIKSNNNVYTGEIVLNRAEVEQYFADYPSENYLEIVLTLTTGSVLETQHELQFSIIVNRSV